eukprot:scaffold175375_cov19-Tisochrysis_lutea.AAC.1
MLGLVASKHTVQCSRLQVCASRARRLQAHDPVQNILMAYAARACGLQAAFQCSRFQACAARARCQQAHSTVWGKRPAAYANEQKENKIEMIRTAEETQRKHTELVACKHTQCFAIVPRPGWHLLAPAKLLLQVDHWHAPPSKQVICHGIWAQRVEYLDKPEDNVASIYQVPSCKCLCFRKT